jgi:hypothetical protein
VAFKVNYGFQKAERDRAKKAKKEAKARERDAAAASGNPLPDDTEAATGDAANDAGTPASDE